MEYACSKAGSQMMADGRALFIISVTLEINKQLFERKDRNFTVRQVMRKDINGQFRIDPKVVINSQHFQG